MKLFSEQRGFDEGGIQRVGTIWAGAEFRMGLSADKEWMVDGLDHFYERPVR
jgi:hypothetical protein